jgi:hypothetical protein
MRTTVRLSDSLLRKAKKYAAEHDTTLTALLDEGLKMVLRENVSVYEVTPKKFRLTTVEGAMKPGIDPTSNAQMLDIAAIEHAFIKHGFHSVLDVTRVIGAVVGYARIKRPQRRRRHRQTCRRFFELQHSHGMRANVESDGQFGFAEESRMH